MVGDICCNVEATAVVFPLLASRLTDTAGVFPRYIDSVVAGATDQRSELGAFAQLLVMRIVIFLVVIVARGTPIVTHLCLNAHKTQATEAAEEVRLEDRDVPQAHRQALPRLMSVPGSSRDRLCNSLPQGCMVIFFSHLGHGLQRHLMFHYLLDD